MFTAITASLALPGLDVALINKYYDLAKAADELAEDHYRNLELKASRLYFVRPLQ